MDQFARSLDTSDKGNPGVLIFFRVTDDCAEIIGRLGANRFFDEIGVCGVTAQHTLLVQEGQAIFDWQNQDLFIKQWQAWEGLGGKSSCAHSANNQRY
jgi:hypothetical protein